MATSPIQVVLNTQNFIESLEQAGGGPNKDFYAGRDTDFAIHKSKVTNQLLALKDVQIEKEFSDISYAKVKLKQSALAKSHRPTTSLFNRDIAPVVGAGDLGELFVEIHAGSIDKLTSKIALAEDVTRWKKNKNDKPIPHPSSIRSEVGAIDEIKPYTASDKRKFSLNDGLKWLSNPQTGGAYVVELFEDPPQRQHWDRLSPSKLTLFRSFFDGFLQLGNGITISRIFENGDKTAMFSIRLEQSQNPTIINLTYLANRREVEKQVELNFNKDLHGALLAFLDKHPLVKRVLLPPVITKSNSNISTKSAGQYQLPKRDPKKSYPKVAIVDGGVADVLGDWIETKWGLLHKNDRDEEHGTFIGGLLVSGQSLNGNEICKEADGCIVIDLDILPTEKSYSNYHPAPFEFFRELELAVKSLKAKTGVRIFNFSLNIEEHVSSTGYSPAAKMLDKIADENDVVFVISAGNTLPADFRKEWPSDQVEALRILAASRNDIIKTPAESCRNISVSALNPPKIDNIIPYALSNYSCRGPAMRSGLKPDLAHVGGCGTRSTKVGHGLFSLSPQAAIIDGCGTSYAAPNVAKTLTHIDHAIEGDVSRESLIGLAIHHAQLPEVFKDKKIKGIAKHLVGFGIPQGSEEVLDGNDNSITLVFANRIYYGKKMSFNFTWPPSLIDSEGKCMGYARLTLVSTPPFDHRYGSEFLRVNVDGYLRQEQDDGSFLGRLKPVYVADEDGDTYEKGLIEHSFKWSPIKVFEKNFRGVGPSSNWKLEVEYLARDGETVPASGVPFTAILTISDPKGRAPVFNEMRQSLQSLGVQILDIKVASRVVARV